MKPSTHVRRIVAGSAAVALALAVASCGGDEATGDNVNGSAVSGTISGAGASSQGAALQAWIAGFVWDNPHVTVNYDPAGSGAGRERFTSGTVDFAASDAYLDAEEDVAARKRCGAAGYIEIPAYISPLAVAYNLQDVDHLNLSPSVMARIFKGEIDTWNHPAITELNPDETLPNTAITPVHRADKSGTTENFVDYLAKAAPEEWNYEVSGNWPAPGGQGAPQTQGVASALRSSQGTIGYLDASQAGDLGMAAVQVGEKFVEHSPAAAAKIVDAAKRVAGRSEYSFAIDLPRDTKEEGAYPIVLVSYGLACVTYDSSEKADTIRAFFSYIVSEQGQKASADRTGSAPLTSTQRAAYKKAIDAIRAA